MSAIVADSARDAGFIVNPVAPDAIRIAPPLNLTIAEIDLFVDETGAIRDVVQNPSSIYYRAEGFLNRAYGDAVQRYYKTPLVAQIQAAGASITSLTADEGRLDEFYRALVQGGAH